MHSQDHILTYSFNVNEVKCEKLSKPLEDFFNDSNDIKLQKDSLIKVLQFLKNETENEERLKEEILDFLSHIFLFTILKHPIRKSIKKLFEQEIFSKINENIRFKLIKVIINNSDDKLFSNLKIIESIINGLYAIVENPYVIIDDISHLIFNFSNNFIDKLLENTEKSHLLLLPDQIYYYLQHITRLTLSFCQKCNFSKIESLELLKTFFKVCNYENVGFETRANSAHVMLIVSKEIFPSEEIVLESFISLLLLNEEDCFLKRMIENLEMLKNEKLKESFRISIMLAVVKEINYDVMEKVKIEDDPVFVYILNELFESTKTNMGNPSQILEITQALMLLTNNNYLNFLNDEEFESIFIQLLTFAFSHLDHYLNTIRSNTSTIFLNTIKRANNNTNTTTNNDYYFIDKILEEIFNNTNNNFYQALQLLSKEIGCYKIINKNPQIPKLLLNNIKKSDVAKEICQCYKNLMELNLKEEEEEDDKMENWSKYWVEPLINFLHGDKEELNKYYNELFVECFKLNRSVLDFIVLLDRSEDVTKIYLNCLQHLRRNGAILDSSKAKDYKGITNGDFLNQLIYNRNDSIRISVLALIVDCHKTTEIYTEWELDFLVRYFEENVSILSANTRQETLALVKKMYGRYKESFNVLKRNSKRKRNSSSFDSKLLKSYEKFWFDFFEKVLSFGLHPGSNYSRRTLCLQILILSYDVIDIKHWTDAFSEENVKNLMEIIEKDTYESNKEMAVDLIRKLRPEKQFLKDIDEIKIYLEQTFNNLFSLKPAEALSGAYMLFVLLDCPQIENMLIDAYGKLLAFKSKEKLYIFSAIFINKIIGNVQRAKENIKKAAENHPLHGLFLGLRQLIKFSNTYGENNRTVYKKIIEQMIRACFMVLPIIFQVVCNSSPEGYVPEDEFGEEEDGTSTAQMLLVYTWRTAKETSLLLGEITMNFPVLDDENLEGLITEDLVEQIGDFFIEFLLTVKHRGAFEQGHLGFTNYCRKLWCLHNKKLRNLPENHLKGIINSLENNLEHINACATRRSAGLPFIVQAILTTEPKTQGNELFNSTMEILLKLSNFMEKEEKIEQVIHSMNILKALYKHNQLGELVTPYAAEGMCIAITGLNSKNWSVRNSATLLLSALMTRIFGVQRNKIDISSKNKLTGHVFFMRHPKLYDFLLNELIKGSKVVNFPSLYGVLLIFGRLFPGKRNEDSKYKLSVFLKHVEFCLCNVVYQIRLLAAIASVAIISEQDRMYYVKKILKKLQTTPLGLNYKHGLLLQLYYFLKIIPTEQIDLKELICLKFEDDLCASLQVEIVMEILKKTPNILVNYSLKDLLDNRKIEKKRILSTDLINNKLSVACRKLISIIYISNDDFAVAKLLSAYLFKLLLSNDEHLRNFALIIIIRVQMGRMCHNLYLTNELEFEDYDQLDFVQLLNPNLNCLLKEILKKTSKIYLVYFYKILKKIKDPKLVAIYFILLSENFQVSNIIFESTNATINFMIEFCRLKNEEIVISSAISFLTRYVKNLLLEESYKKREDFSDLVEFLESCFHKTNSVAVKLSLCDFLTENTDLFCFENYNNYVKEKDKSKLWCLLITLTEDDDILVRNRISGLELEPFHYSNINQEFLPLINCETIEVFKKKIIERSFKSINENYLLEYLLELIFRNFEVDDHDLSNNVFDRGSINIYSEVLFTTLKAQNKVKEIISEMQMEHALSRLNSAFRNSNLPLKIKNGAQEILNELNFNNYLLVLQESKYNIFKKFLSYIFEMK